MEQQQKLANRKATEIEHRRYINAKLDQQRTEAVLMTRRDAWTHMSMYRDNEEPDIRWLTYNKMMRDKYNAEKATAANPVAGSVARLPSNAERAQMRHAMITRYNYGWAHEYLSQSIDCPCRCCQ